MEERREDKCRGFVGGGEEEKKNEGGRQGEGVGAGPRYAVGITEWRCASKRQWSQFWVDHEIHRFVLNMFRYCRAGMRDAVRYDTCLAASSYQ